MVTPERDIYEVLGIDPSASSALAREIYWRRVGGFLEADRTGDATARPAIDELNEALSIVMDRTLRTEYDAQRKSGGAARLRSTASAVGETVERRGHRRSVMIVLLIPVLVASVWAAFDFGTPLIGLGALIAAFAALLLGARWATKETVRGQSPFHLLKVGADASIEELDTAYENQVHELLLNVRGDPRVLRRLELLDEAYIRASTIVAQGESGLIARRKPRGIDWVGLQAERAGAGLLRGFQRASLTFLRLIIAAIGVLGRGLASGASSVGRRLSSSPDPAEPQGTEAAQVERRLTNAFRSVAERAATTPVAVDGSAEAPPMLDAALVLGSRAGNRRIAIGPVPIRIGSAPHSQIVLRETGVAPDHAIIWQRDGLLLLHVTDGNASCLVNDRPMSWATLEDGDELKLGEAIIHVQVKRAPVKE